MLAVNHCHTHGIVHRDIKMENILVDCHEETDMIHIELTDFGLASYESDIENMS